MTNKMTTFAALGLANVATEELTLSSLDFLNDYINPARAAAGEKPVRNNDFVKRIEDECDDLNPAKIEIRFGNSVTVYDLNMDQLMLVGMRESKAVRRAVLARLKALEEEHRKAKEFQLPQNYVEALEVLLETTKERDALKDESFNKTHDFHTLAVYFGNKCHSERCMNALVRGGYLVKHYSGKTAGGNPRSRGYIPTEKGTEFCVVDTIGKKDPYKSVRFSVKIFDILADLGAITRNDAARIKNNPPSAHFEALTKNSGLKLEVKPVIDFDALPVFEDDIDLNEFAA